MIIKEEKIDSSFVLSPVGRIDANTAPELELKLMAVLDGGETDVVVNFHMVDYISSSGLRVLLMGAKKLDKAGKKMKLSNLKSQIMEVFNIAGFTAIFEIS
ncbi:MAG: STAS domain-containing protein [Bacteroidetes bacterium]|nr:STAS domain-containing protein [Bacteroidota bacterium]MBU1678532.1 STAS domain-containing protein [Bacteroidota bacterium]MBU2508245.1 STAS domain-containing protein [Bacteroidota bacterium]